MRCEDLENLCTCFCPASCEGISRETSPSEDIEAESYDKAAKKRIQQDRNRRA